MAENYLKVVSVFIASPGGLEDERESARRIVEEINESHSEHWGCRIKLVGWEATLPGYNRAQSLINQDLDKCDYFVGVIWNHWGSKPQDGDSRFTSGFEEEFERAKDRLNQGLMKDIILFFKDIPEVQLRDSGPSVARVLTFRQACVDSYKIMFKQFPDKGEFERLIRIQIEAIGWKEAPRKLEAEPELINPEQPSGGKTSDSGGHEPTDGLIAYPTSEFVRELLDRPAGDDAVDAYEVARLRLVSASVHKQGNDKVYLGNHDANLLFHKREEFDFSRREIRELIDVGINRFDSQNVPLWCWLSEGTYSDDPFKRISEITVFGSSDDSVNAIRILQLAEMGVPSFGAAFDKKNVIDFWLSDNSESEVIKAALELLSSCADQDDFKAVEEMFSLAQPESKDQIAVTLISILLRHNVVEAFALLSTLDPETQGVKLRDRLFAIPEAIPTDSLIQCLKLKSDPVRREASKILSDRDAIDLETAKRLITDSDIEVRLVAARVLLNLGNAPTDQVVKQALTKPRSGGFFGVRGSEDDSSYREYRRLKLAKLSYDELRTHVKGSSIFADLELSVLYEKYFRNCAAEMRQNLADSFKAYFDEKFEEITSTSGADSKLARDTLGLESHLRGTWVSLTLDIICKMGGRKDLQLVRDVLDEGSASYFSQSVLHFLARNGDWTDIARVLSYSEKHPSDGTFLTTDFSKKARDVASAIYAIGKSRLIDLLSVDVDKLVKRELFKIITQKDLLRLSDGYLLGEFLADDHSTRGILSLRCVEVMAKSRIRKLLDTYADQEGERYYNVIHWLDLGNSMPRELAKTVARNQLAVL